MNREDLFGAVGITLRQAAEAVTDALGVTFELRDSSFYGGDYYSSCPVERDLIRVVENFEDHYDGELFEPDFPEFPILIYIDRSSNEFARALEAVPQVQLLESKVRLAQRERGADLGP